MLKKMLACVLCLMLCASFMCGLAAGDPFEGMNIYDEGQYRVGYDLPADEYMLLATTNYSGYFCMSTDANQKNIIANDLFETNSIVTVRFGEYLELSRCLAIPTSQFYTEYSIKDGLSGVMLKVGYGYDIMPGTYKLRVTDSKYSGYYCVYNDSRHDDIEANDLFKGSCYVTVQSGQYLILSRCVIV